MIPIFKPLVYLHSDAFIPECNCGDREWEVELPLGYYFDNYYPSGGFNSMQDAMTYAATLHPGHPDIKTV